MYFAFRTLFPEISKETTILQCALKVSPPFAWSIMGDGGAKYIVCHQSTVKNYNHSEVVGGGEPGPKTNRSKGKLKRI